MKARPAENAAWYVTCAATGLITTSQATVTTLAMMEMV